MGEVEGRCSQDGFGMLKLRYYRPQCWYLQVGLGVSTVVDERQSDGCSRANVDFPHNKAGKRRTMTAACSPVIFCFLDASYCLNLSGAEKYT